MAIVEVRYNVPVGVIIDTETSEIQSVLEFGDLIKIDSEDTVVDQETQLTVDPETAKQAIRVAETADWPARDIG